MLSTLHIENIAVIEAADITFGVGFNVLTGETGAGKSIVIDAIGAVMGYRTSRDLIRSGAQQAYVSALFQGLLPISWLTEHNLELEEGGSLLLERSITSEGKNVCRIQGRPVTVSQLRELGGQILNIHGQHDGQLLLDERTHLNYLDHFGDTERELEDYQAAFSALRKLRQEMDTLELDESEKARRVDTLTYQIAELEQAQLQEGEEEQLRERRDLLRNAERLMEAVEGSYAALQGDDDSDGAVNLLDSAGRLLQQGARISETLSDLAKRAEELRYQALDLAELVGDFKGSLDMSEGELDRIEGRLDLLFRLQKKYGSTTSDMLAFLDRARMELTQIAFAAERREQLAGLFQKAGEKAQEKAVQLSQKRKTAKVILEKKIHHELVDLDMPSVRFSIEFSEVSLGETGIDEVAFYMSANVGENLKAIHKIASGGELARIMLALKNVLSESDSVSTMIFDEVDTGVSGRAAQRVAEKMSDLSHTRQVLCVTHLPQLAAMADAHYCVEKGEKDGRTFTIVESLSRERRCEELARITGGTNVSKTLLQSAEELLQSAEKYKYRG